MAYCAGVRRARVPEATLASLACESEGAERHDRVRRERIRRYHCRVLMVSRRTPRALREYWSQRVTEMSNALDLEPGVFTLPSPRAIARSLKRSAEISTRRKAGAYQSAMSMLNLYINRAGRNLSPTRRRTLERAKDELRKAFGRT